MLRYCVVSYSPLVAEYDATRGFVTMFSVFCCHSSWVGWLELSRCFFSCTREGWGINSCLDRLPNDPPPPPPQPETCSGIVFESSSGLEKSHISTYSIPVLGPGGPLGLLANSNQSLPRTDWDVQLHRFKSSGSQTVVCVLVVFRPL